MQYAIEIKNLCKQYPKFALQSVSFTLPMGYIMGFIGENGAGKTTVMKSMLHLVRPDSGKVLLLGQDATKENAALKQANMASEPLFPVRQRRLILSRLW